jgi:hypothetical protein
MHGLHAESDTKKDIQRFALHQRHQQASITRQGWSVGAVGTQLCQQFLLRSNCSSSVMAPVWCSNVGKVLQPMLTSLAAMH